MRDFATLLYGRAVDAAAELDAGINDPTVRELMAALTNALARIDRLERAGAEQHASIKSFAKIAQEHRRAVMTPRETP